MARRKRGTATLYQLACLHFTEGDYGVHACGVSYSLDGIMRLMRRHAAGLLYIEPDDPFLHLPVPAAGAIPATIEYEWDDARVRVEYVIQRAAVPKKAHKKRGTSNAIA